MFKRLYVCDLYMHMCDYVYKVHIDNLFLPISLTLGESKIEKGKCIYLFYFFSEPYILGKLPDE